jgi:hypothetical protein
MGLGYNQNTTGMTKNMQSTGQRANVTHAIDVSKIKVFNSNNFKPPVETAPKVILVRQTNQPTI